MKQAILVLLHTKDPTLDSYRLSVRGKVRCSLSESYRAYHLRSYSRIIFIDFFSFEDFRSYSDHGSYQKEIRINGFGV